MKRYPFPVKDRVRYMGLVLLNEIINFQHYFPVRLQGHDAYLKPYLAQMQVSGILEIKDNQYIPTLAGRIELQNFYDRYQEFLQMFDIYCAVDLEAGEFAFSSKNDEAFVDSDDEWFAFLNEERFSDVRVAVADFKGINPNEIVFMSFLQERRFDIVDADGNEIDGWQYALTDEAGVWQEIEDITDSAIPVEHLLPNGVLEDVIKQGTQIAMDIIKEADELDRQDQEAEDAFYDEQDEVIEEVTEYVEVVELPYYEYEYYEPYYDPYYISPIWLLPVLLW